MCANQMFSDGIAPFSVRRFEAKDRSGVMALYAAYSRHGCASGMADLASASFEGDAAGHQMWVAEAGGRIIGSAAVISHEVRVAHFKNLSVATDQFDRHRVARGIAKLAVADVWERGYLKLIVHTEAPANRVAADLRDMGFAFSRERDVGGEHVLEFYQNFYELPASLAHQADGAVDADVVLPRFTKSAHF